MAEKERTDIIIEGNTATWESNVTGTINGTYIGTFRFRCFLTPTQQIAASREMRELLGPEMTMAPEHESFLAYALTQLKHRIISSPPFWSSAVGGGGMQGDVPDENVISAVLDAAIGAEIKYKNQLSSRKLEAIERAKKAAERMISNKEVEDDDEGEDTESRNQP
jgi:hypothetical protein